MKKWKTLSSKMAFDNKWMPIRQDKTELPNGKIIDDYFVWEEPNVVQVVPITQNGEFVFVKQYKHGVGDIVLEFPAGYIEKDEDPQVAAIRELQEETGYTSSKLKLICKLSRSPSKASSIDYVYLAENITQTGQTNFDPNEEIESVLCTREETLEKIKSGEIRITGTIAAYFLALENL